MHPEAFQYIRRALRSVGWTDHVLEIGGRDVNGGVRAIVQPRVRGRYTSIDLIDGPGVDVVADGACYGEANTYGLVICTEVLEHTAQAEAIVANAHRVLAPGGVLILTAAWTGRPPHSAVDGGPLRRTGATYLQSGLQPEPAMLEYYASVTEHDLVRWLRPFARWSIEVDNGPCDIRATAWK